MSVFLCEYYCICLADSWKEALKVKSTILSVFIVANDRVPRNYFHLLLYIELVNYESIAE